MAAFNGVFMTNFFATDAVFGRVQKIHHERVPAAACRCVHRSASSAAVQRRTVHIAVRGRLFTNERGHVLIRPEGGGEGAGS